MNIILYSTPTCPFCKQVKAFFLEQGMDFTDIDVMADQDKAREMIQKSGQMGVPVVDIDGNIIVGFDQKKMKELIGIE